MGAMATRMRRTGFSNKHGGGEEEEEEEEAGGGQQKAAAARPQPGFGTRTPRWSVRVHSGLKLG